MGPIDYQRLFQAAPAAYLLLSPAAGYPILDANTLYLAATNCTRDTIVDRPIFEVFPDNPDDPKADGEMNLGRSLAHVISTCRSEVMPLQRHAVRDSASGAFQERYWSVMNWPVLDDAGQVRYIIHRAEDVTALILLASDPSQLDGKLLPSTMEEIQVQLLRRARDLENLNRNLSSTNQALQLSEKRFRQLAENSTFGLMISDLEGTVSYLNPSMQELTGYTADDVAAGNVPRDWIYPPNATARDAKAIKDLRLRGNCAPYVKNLLAKDGHSVAVMLGASVLAPRDGIVEVASFVLDLSEKIRVEELLRSSDLKHRTMIESLPQLVWTTMRDGYCNYLSPQWVAYTGIPEHQQHGFAWLDLVMHPEDRERVSQAWMKAIAGEAAYDLEYRLRRHDGIYRWFKTRGVPFHDNGGQVVEWFGTCTDIDDQIRSEQEARLAIEERGKLWREYDTALSNNPDTSYSFDLNGKFTYANRALLSLLQKPLSEIVGRTFDDLDYPSELAHRLTSQIQKVITTGEPIRDETPFTDASGRTRVYDYIFTPVFAEDRVEAVTGSSRDITERKNAEEQVRESEQRLRFALQSGRMNGWNYGPELAERHVGAWLRGSADSVEVWNAQTLQRILPSEECQRVSLLFDKALRSGNELETEIRIQRNGEEDRWVWVRAGANLTLDGTPRLSGLISDVTERRVLDEKLRESARLESVGVLAGGIAHDFNNLLTGILGNASLAIDEVQPDHPIAPLLANVVRASERASELTNQILAYSGRGRFLVKQIELSPFIREVSAMITASIPRHVHLNYRLRDPLPFVQADVTQLQQVVMNLIVNAAEAIPSSKRGDVTIITEFCQLSHTQLAALRNAFEAEPGFFVAFSVEDNGSGMDDTTQRKIFDPFFTTKFTGRGLGLSAVLGILRSHKGAIGIDSQLGRGTKITVYFPALPGSAPELPIASTPSTTALKQGVVLVIDDEETVRTVATAMLRQSGFDVLLANDGEQGVALFKQRHQEIRAVLLDLSMPVMDGESALPLLREINPVVPIILSTGYSELEASARFAKEKLAAVLQKPYKSAQMKEALRLALQET